MIFNDDAGAKPVGERLRNEPGGNVGGPAGGEGNDDLDGSRRIVLSLARRGGHSGEEQREKEEVPIFDPRAAALHPNSPDSDIKEARQHDANFDMMQTPRPREARGRASGVSVCVNIEKRVVRFVNSFVNR
jgi:hypothetical protein